MFFVCLGGQRQQLLFCLKGQPSQIQHEAEKSQNDNKS